MMVIIENGVKIHVIADTAGVKKKIYFFVLDMDSTHQIFIQSLSRASLG